jgi:hypothetical protein
MKVIRKVEMDVDKFKVGDQISIKLRDMGTFTATVQKASGAKAYFIFDNCVADRPMNEDPNKAGDFKESDLCKWMNTELIKMFPKSLRDNMLHNTYKEVKLWIPTYGEMFGHDDYYERFETDKDNQLPLMKDRKNRVCSSPDDEYCWYWLQNRLRGVYSAASFAIVDFNSLALGSGASNSIGVRPAFSIKNH